MKEDEFILKNFTAKKILGPDGFLSEFALFKEEIISILHKLA